MEIKKLHESDSLFFRFQLAQRFPHTPDPKIKESYDQLVAEADAIAQLHAGFVTASLNTQNMTAELALTVPYFLMLTSKQLHFLHALSASANHLTIVPQRGNHFLHIHAYFPYFRRVPVDTVSHDTLFMLSKSIVDQYQLALTDDDVKKEIAAVLDILRKEEIASAQEKECFL